jgi:hypothetical protein
MWTATYEPFVQPLEDAGTRIRPVAPEAAQSMLNFPVLRPRYLPSDTRMTEALLRVEAPPTEDEAVERGARPPDWTSANTCSYLMRFAGAGRRFRLKQFFYDWAPPACDHPPLWAGAVRPVPSVPPYVTWIGTDFMERAGATSRINRTSVEMSIAEGAYTDEEIAAIFTGLEPVDGQAARVLEAQSFAKLTYWSRHDLPVVNVPYGLFRFGRSDDAERGAWVSGALETPGIRQPRLDPASGFALDSTGTVRRRGKPRGGTDFHRTARTGPRGPLHPAGRRQGAHRLAARCLLPPGQWRDDNPGRGRGACPLHRRVSRPLGRGLRAGGHPCAGHDLIRTWP